MIPRAGIDVSVKRRILPCQELNSDRAAPKPVTIQTELSRPTVSVTYNFYFHVSISDLKVFYECDNILHYVLADAPFLAPGLLKRKCTIETDYLLRQCRFQLTNVLLIYYFNFIDHHSITAVAPQSIRLKHPIRENKINNCSHF